MNEFMLLIRNQRERPAGFAEKEESFLNACRDYIGELKKEGKLISAQPLVREGTMVSGTPKSWNEETFSESNEIIVGYYHILAKDLKEAIEIANKNPEFSYTITARVEVRPIKMKEATIGFVYPNKKS